MTWRKKLLAAVLSALLAGSLCACNIPGPGFSDYDVSSYVQALLDSSYLQENDDFMAITASTEERAKQNNVDAVENAAVLFCNAYGISPTDAQLVELQKVMRQAYQLAKYTVKEEQKTDSGYYLEVEVTPITNFRGRTADLEKLKVEAQNEATAINEPSSLPESSEEDYWTDDDTEDDWEDDDEESSEVSSTPEPQKTVSANELFVDKVIEFCKNELKSLSFDTPVTISMDILQTKDGELQLDMNQVSVIDRTVIYLAK